MSKQSDEKLDLKFWLAFAPFVLVVVAMAIFTVAETAIKFGWVK